MSERLVPFRFKAPLIFACRLSSTIVWTQAISEKLQCRFLHQQADFREEASVDVWPRFAPLWVSMPPRSQISSASLAARISLGRGRKPIRLPGSCCSWGAITTSILSGSSEVPTTRFVTGVPDWIGTDSRDFGHLCRRWLIAGDSSQARIRSWMSCAKFLMARQRRRNRPFAISSDTGKQRAPSNDRGGR